MSLGILNKGEEKRDEEKRTTRKQSKKQEMGLHQMIADGSLGPIFLLHEI